MHFGLDETQEIMRATAADFLSTQSSSDFVRAMAEDERGYTQDFWREIALLGWLGLLIPENHDGAQMNMTDMAVLLTEWGAAIAPGPIVESSVMSAKAIESFGSQELQARWLPLIADGSAIAIPAIASGQIETIASEISDGWVLSGSARFVSYANSADLLLVPARNDSLGTAIFAIDIQDVRGTLSQHPVKMASGAPTFHVDLNEVELSSAAILGDAGTAESVLSEIMLYGAAARAVQMAGAGRTVLERTLEYVKERKQFGRAIGTFQAIQHYMAEMSIKVKSVKHLADRAAWALDNVDDPVERSKLVSQAKWAANKLIPEVCWTAHQSHGAIGFTWEHDLHLYTRRILTWRTECGDTAQHIDALARAV